MELTREERERVKARFGNMLTGEPITDVELENLARVAPAAGLRGRATRDTCRPVAMRYGARGAAIS
jgi:hypothetical protein